MGRPAPTGGREQLRWRLADDDGGRPDLLGDAVRQPGRGELAGLELLHVRARSVLNRVPNAGQLPFRWTVNPYRGCSHACVYCFARPTHEYLGLGIGDDFDRRIVVKVNAVELLRAELAAPGWGGETVALGTNTDPYQPCEGRYRLTRGVLETLDAAANPFSILTKSTLILRDADVLGAAAAAGRAEAALSIGCLDPEVWRATEPHAPDPRRRMEAVARLNAAGVPCGVMVAPVLPGISDAPRMLEEVVRAAVDAGATAITPIMLHLRPGVREHYLAWLESARPELRDEYARRYPRAYARPEDARALSERVRELVARHGGPRPRPARGPDAPPPRFGSRPAPALSPTEPRQLRLMT